MFHALSSSGESFLRFNSQRAADADRERIRFPFLPIRPSVVPAVVPRRRGRWDIEITPDMAEEIHRIIDNNRSGIDGNGIPLQLPVPSRDIPQPPNTSC